MKLSLAWIFDHIDADVRSVDVPALVHLFNQTTAEIEGFQEVRLDLDSLALVEIKSTTSNGITAHCAQLKKEIELPARKDAIVGQIYLIKIDGKNYLWARMDDIGGGKDHLLPAVHVDESLRAGEWKKRIETHDYILEGDNKSITNRPDMWGHRGFAREIAAMLKVRFKKIDEFIINAPIEQHESVVNPSKDNPLAIIVKNTDIVPRFAGMYMSDVQPRPSSLAMMFRLARVDAKPINAIVDITNYVMLDIGQPMHAFDADKIDTVVMPRLALKGEKITLLDGQKIELTEHDLVISDQEKPLALAGIMGGLESAVTASTKSLFLEAASFNATTIRRSATHHKIRTEASARFEKTLDPNQNTLALMRFLKLMQDLEIPYSSSETIYSCGKPAPEKTIAVRHDFLESRLGVSLAVDWVIETLQRLEFKVEYADEAFIVTIPSFRASKDIGIREDILEEVGRMYGYTNIVPQLPAKQTTPSDLHAVHQERLIKSVMIHTLQMHELSNYAFFDEDFLRKLSWQPMRYLSVLSPVSDNWRRLVTTLIPHLLKAVEHNCNEYDQLRFFEWARVWHKEEEAHYERKVVSAIFFDKKKPIDFYETKAQVQQLFDALKLPVVWHKIIEVQDPWFLPYQSALLYYQDEVIGIAGKINPLSLASISEGDAFLIELDADFLLEYQAPTPHYQEQSKYPAAVRDVSILIPLAYTVDDLSTRIKNSNALITSVQLMDYFEKPEWHDQRSLTFRFVVQDPEKTLTKEEVEEVWNTVANTLKELGATIR